MNFDLFVLDVEKQPRLTIHEFATLYDYTPKLLNHQNLAEAKTITSHGDEASCGISLGVHQVYLLFGSLSKREGGAFISMCGTIVHQLPKSPSAEEAKELLDKTYEERCGKGPIKTIPILKPDDHL